MTQVPNLWMVETVDSAKLADRLQTAAAAVMEQRGNEPLRVLIQVGACVCMCVCGTGRRTTSIM